MSVAAFITALRKAGVPAEQILDAVEVMERERLAKGRARTAKCRNAKRNGDVTHVTDVTSVTSAKPQKIEPRATHVGDNSKPLETSVSKEEKETTAPPSSVSPFDEFWSVYPKRIGDNPKKPARAKFEAACRNGDDPQAIIGAARRLAAQHPTPSVYVPQAVTWLNQERWKDEPTQTGPPPENVVKFRTVEEIMAQVEALNGGRAESL